ncbi:CD59 glycoprotein-like [Candoia aspera]|uniref:CD59 glycoprotein-like n=1 Tax=Candoia aspera TaxID=51853 RepID=UPI002FD810C1
MRKHNYIYLQLYTGLANDSSASFQLYNRQSASRKTMRKIVFCVLALMLWSQAVDALVCYNCPNGGGCTTTTTCSVNQNQCMTIIIAPKGMPHPRIAKRCSSTHNCRMMNSMPESGVLAICCGFDRCNN